MSNEIQFDRLEVVAGWLLLVAGALGVLARRGPQGRRRAELAALSGVMLLGVSLIGYRLPPVVRLSFMLSVGLSLTSVVLRRRNRARDAT